MTSSLDLFGTLGQHCEVWRNHQLVHRSLLIPGALGTEEPRLPRLGVRCGLDMAGRIKIQSTS
jgi:hypothetical protein